MAGRDLTRLPACDITARHGAYLEGDQFLNVSTFGEGYHRGGEVDVHFSCEEGIHFTSEATFIMGEDCGKHLLIYAVGETGKPDVNAMSYLPLCVHHYVGMMRGGDPRMALELRANKKNVISKRALLGLGTGISRVRNFDGTD